ARGRGERGGGGHHLFAHLLRIAGRNGNPPHLRMAFPPQRDWPTFPRARRKSATTHHSTMEIRRASVHDLTYEQFIEEHWKPGIPLVFTDASKVWKAHGT